jgi:hypothetical protein
MKKITRDWFYPQSQHRYRRLQEIGFINNLNRDKEDYKRMVLSPCLNKDEEDCKRQILPSCLNTDEGYRYLSYI